MKNKYKVIYEFAFAIMAVISVCLSVLDFIRKIDIHGNTIYYFMDLSILIVFAIDYFTRLFLAENKKKFFKDNIFDLLSIIPVNPMFRAFRFARIFRILWLVRLIGLLHRFNKHFGKFLRTNNFIYILYTCAGVYSWDQ